MNSDYDESVEKIRKAGEIKASLKIMPKWLKWSFQMVAHEHLSLK